MAKSPTPLYHKLIICILAGLIFAASFNRIAPRFLGRWLPDPVIMGITLLLMLGPILYAVRWHLKEKSLDDGNSTLDVWQGILRFGLAFDLALFGWFKLFHLQFWVPLEKLDEPFGSISGQWLTWMYFGRSYPMDFTVGIFQVAASLLLLFSKTRLAAVFVIIPILLNIFLIDIFYELGAVGIHAGIMLAGSVYLLLCEYDSLKQFFFYSTDRIMPVNINSIIKIGLRSCLVLIPLLMIFTHESADLHPQLKGKYEVEKISINGLDKTSAINCDSVLTVVYLEVGNTCIFQFKSYKQRIIGAYEYREGSDLFKVKWLTPEEHRSLGESYKVSQPLSDLEATLTIDRSRYMKLSGKMGNDMLEVHLSKVE